MVQRSVVSCSIGLTTAAGGFGAHVITSGEIEDAVRAIRSLMRFNPHASGAGGP